MRILITGGTGLIGKEIVEICRIQNIEVNYLTTRKSKIEQSDNYNGFYWNPTLKEIDVTCFDKVDAIIHLAGASISKRWTTNYKKEIISSRVESTQLLIDALKDKPHTIKHIISGSAIGIYPDSLINYYDESSIEANASFLSHVVKKWEKAVDDFSKLDINISKIRTGLVLSNKGGALREMVKPIKFGVGAAFGSGKHWQSWIHIKDISNMFVFLLQHKLYGTYNGVSPNPETNKQLTKTIAKVLNRPLLLPNIPKFVMKILLGDMHKLLFESQRVSSKKIEDRGFIFKYHHLKPAIIDILG